MDNVDDIFSFVRDRYGYSKGAILGKNRSRDVVEARHIAMFLVVEKCGLSYPQAGKLFRRDHSTVLAAYQKVHGNIIDGKLNLDEQITGYEPKIRHTINLDEALEDGLDLVRKKINAAFQRDPIATFAELAALARRLDGG